MAGRRCVVVGAGRIAPRKIEGLLAAGADVEVVAPEAVDGVRALADAGTVRWSAREFVAADLDDAWLAVTATSTPEVNRAVFVAGEARRVWVNAADDPANCSFSLMSVVRQGDIVVTIGTNGRSPALATFLKDHVATRWARSTRPCSSCSARPGKRSGPPGVPARTPIGGGPSIPASST